MSITSVLASLYPIVTLILAQFVLRERVARSQRGRDRAHARRRRADLGRLERQAGNAALDLSRIARTVSRSGPAVVPQLHVDVLLARDDRARIAATHRDDVGPPTRHQAVSSLLRHAVGELGHQLYDFGMDVFGGSLFRRSARCRHAARRAPARSVIARRSAGRRRGRSRAESSTQRRNGFRYEPVVRPRTAARRLRRAPPREAPSG